VGDDWYVQAPDVTKFFFGIWRIDSASGNVLPHDVTAVKGGEKLYQQGGAKLYH